MNTETTTPKGNTIPVGRPTWKNVLHKGNKDTRDPAHISEWSALALLVGYPYILWNDRIYYVWDADDSFPMATDTGWTTDDVHKHTLADVQSP